MCLCLRIYAWFYVLVYVIVCICCVFMLYISRYLLSKHLTVSNLDQSKFTLKEHTISVCP